jgi:hypothetical protein
LGSEKGSKQMNAERALNWVYAAALLVVATLLITGQ